MDTGHCADFIAPNTSIRAGIVGASGFSLSPSSAHDGIAAASFTATPLQEHPVFLLPLGSVHSSECWEQAEAGEVPLIMVPAPSALVPGVNPVVDTGMLGSKGANGKKGGQGSGVDVVRGKAVM